jgi:hypothetical protein
MDTKFTLALIALGGIGVFALPSTVALFAGQHSFYNIDATGNQVPCVKCHGDVKAELGSGGSTTTGTGGAHANFKCEYCHRAESGFASGDNAYAKITYSNASGSKIYLVTTIYNFENGNFPKAITYQTGMTVDNWAGNVWDLQGNAFIPINGTETGTSNDTNYSGSLSTNGVAGDVYNYSYSSEVATETSAGPKDTNPNTATTAFNAKAITWSGSTENLTGAGSRMVTPGTKYHAASLVSCLECHGGEQNKGVAGYQINTSEPYNHAGWLIDPTDPNNKCSNCHYGGVPGTGSFEADLAAGGFGLTTNANDTGSVEAHSDFVRAPGGVLRNGYGAANDACVACHTHVAVDITFQKKYVLKFDANANQGGAYQNDSNSTTARTGAWDVGGFSAQGTVNVEEFGNGTGGAFATGNYSYNWTPSPTLYIMNSNGTLDEQVMGLNNEANDSTGALTSP